MIFTRKAKTMSAKDSPLPTPSSHHHHEPPPTLPPVVAALEVTDQFMLWWATYNAAVSGVLSSPQQTFLSAHDVATRLADLAHGPRQDPPPPVIP